MSSELEKIVGPRVPADELKAHRMRYIIPTLLFVAAAVLLIISIQRPWWRLKLNAPQYPAGLYVTAYVNRMAGDVAEIDGLNHYIGMRPLAEAAVLEQSISVFGIIGAGAADPGRGFVHSKLGGAAGAAGAAAAGLLSGRPAILAGQLWAESRPDRGRCPAASIPLSRPCCGRARSRSSAPCRAC
jgi:hypothetical protein